jgi:hypothetical protein
MRPDVVTRQWNEAVEEVSAALSRKTEPSKPSVSPNKPLKLEAGILGSKIS